MNKYSIVVAPADEFWGVWILNVNPFTNQTHENLFWVYAKETDAKNKACALALALECDIEWKNHIL